MIPRLAILLPILCLVVPTLRSGDIALIPVAEPWRYFKGIQEPTPAWASTNFNDTLWAENKAGFSNLGGFGEATTFSDYGLTYSTVYFRKRFVLADPQRIKELILRLDYDDGFIAFLNGREVARRGVAGAPGIPVPVTAISTPHPRGLTEEIDLTAGIEALRSGENIMAVQILGNGMYDWSMSFVPELLANFTRSPYVQNNTTTSAQIAWKTFSPRDGLIEFGTNLSSATTVEVDTAKTNHLASLDGLAPDTRYVYRVGTRFGEEKAWSDWSSFRTFKASGSFSFALIADTGWATPQQYQVAEQMRRTDVDLIVHAGDLTYGAINERSSDLRLLSVYAQQMRTTPMFLAIGNHDALIDIRVPLELFHLPTNNVTGTEHYYSFDHGDAHFSVVWSDLAAGARYHPGSPQYLWLEQDLANTRKPWKFIFFHHCWRTSALHRQDDYDLNGVPDGAQLEAIAELAGRQGVQSIFHGHDHCYERFTPRFGVMSFIGGGGGAALYPMWVAHPDSVQFQARHNFLKVTVNPDVTTVQAIDEFGRLFDVTHLSRDFPEERVYEAAWHTPTIESLPADDLYGNIFGQTFDFAGSPLAARFGQTTSAGRLFVNNDAEFLYLGLDEVMLHPGEEVHLFVETPEAPLAIDPRGFGWNIQFTHFAPTVVAIVGDEYQDLAGQRQGLRFLREGLPAVPGQRLQQFNRSPQNIPVGHEKNANFIEMAVPLTALGLTPGNTIRVAAVVGLGAGNPRQFDSGGILRPSGSAVAPLTVRLASTAPPDSDLDGMADGTELLAGTNPLDASSTFRASARRQSNGEIELTWSAVAGKWYRLEFIGGPGSQFRDFPHFDFPRRAAQEVERASFPTGNLRPFEYYRVVLIPD